jgi:hypothetical protein
VNQENITQGLEAVLGRKSKVWLYASANSEQQKRKSKHMDNFKENTLKGHVQLCELRYKALEERLDNVESKLEKLENDVSQLKIQTQQGFSEIKLLLERQNSSKQIQLIATFGTIVTAILAFAGYLITK